MYSFWRLSCNGYRSFRRFSWVQIPPGNVYLTRYPAIPPSKFLELRSLDRFSRGLLEMFRSYVSSENRFTIASSVKLYRYCLVRKEKWSRLARMVVLVRKAGIFRQPWSPGANRATYSSLHLAYPFFRVSSLVSVSLYHRRARDSGRGSCCKCNLREAESRASKRRTVTRVVPVRFPLPWRWVNFHSRLYSLFPQATENKLPRE